jgi:hypothetical protein
MRWALIAGVLVCFGGVVRGQATPPVPVPASPTQAADSSVEIRVATFNIEDVRTRDLADPAQPRLRRLAEVIQRIRPTVILLNEITYDVPGGPDVPEGSPGGHNAQTFADRFLATAQASDLEPLHFKAFMAPTNTGMPSGFDLDHDGHITTTYPAPAAAAPDGGAPAQTDEGRAYGSDCWGL